ncbi:MAG: hypothetical protein IJG49_09345 [Erysipelotrichaceae bacterium]|nr:hypothetical protein [Erysipelotrichaceae bacterium]
MKLINKKETIILYNDRLIVDCGDELYLHPLKEIKKIFIMTTSQMLLNQTVFLVFETDQEFYIMGILHPDFQHLLASVNRIFDTDENVVIDAMQHVGQKEFTLYQRGI